MFPRTSVPPDSSSFLPVLPDAVSRQDGVFNLSRAALMSVSLYSGNYRNLRVAADDRLHQPYRLGLIRGGGAVMEVCYSLGGYIPPESVPARIRPAAGF